MKLRAKIYRNGRYVGEAKIISVVAIDKFLFINYKRKYAGDRIVVEWGSLQAEDGCFPHQLRARIGNRWNDISAVRVVDGTVELTFGINRSLVTKEVSIYNGITLVQRVTVVPGEPIILEINP